MREEENNHDKKDISNILEILPLLLWGKSTNEGRHFFFLQPIQVSRSLTGIQHTAFVSCLYTRGGEMIFNSVNFCIFFYSQVKK